MAADPSTASYTTPWNTTPCAAPAERRRRVSRPLAAMVNGVPGTPPARGHPPRVHHQPEAPGDRAWAPRPAHRAAVRAAVGQPVRVLPPACGRDGGEPGADAPDRCAVLGGAAVLAGTLAWLAPGGASPAAGRPWCRAQAGSAPDGPGTDPPAAADEGAEPGTGCGRICRATVWWASRARSGVRT